MAVCSVIIYFEMKKQCGGRSARLQAQVQASSQVTAISNETNNACTQRIKNRTRKRRFAARIVYQRRRNDRNAPRRVARLFDNKFREYMQNRHGTGWKSVLPELEMLDLDKRHLSKYHIPKVLRYIRKN